MAYTSEEERVIWIVSLVCGSISVICCLFIIMCFVLLPSLRGYEYRLILYITFADMSASIIYMVPSSSNDDICSFQGAILCFTEALRVGFTLHMSVFLHSTVRDSEDKIKKFEKLFVLTIFTTCCVLAGLPFITSSYGNVEGLCWIEVNSESYTSDNILRFLVSYIPLWVVIFYTYWVYYLIFRNMRNLCRSSLVSKSYAEGAQRKLLLYPGILTICWLPSAICRSIEFYHPGFQNIILKCLSQGIIVGLGFFNGLAYGFTPEVKAILLKLCLRRNEIDLNYESDVGRLN
jgi:hypothetical protein